MVQKVPGRFWVIRHQDQSKPQVVAKFDTAGETQIPDDVANHDTFQVLEVSDRGEMIDQTIDHSNLTESDKGVLGQVYPVQD